jgi:hypothetical protein
LNLWDLRYLWMPWMPFWPIDTLSTRQDLQVAIEASIIEEVFYIRAM